MLQSVRRVVNVAFILATRVTFDFNGLNIVLTYICMLVSIIAINVAFAIILQPE